MKPIIAIEGISYAGKTTLSKLLSGDKFARLYELAERFDNGKGFPPFPNNMLEALESEEWFIQQELIRACEAKDLASDKVVIADRSFVSGLAFAYARDHTYGIGDRTFRQHDSIRKQILSRYLFVPWIIYLRIDIDTYFRRKDEYQKKRITEFGEDAVRNVTVNDKEHTYIEHIIRYYDTVFGNCNFQYLTLDGRASLEQLVTLVQEWTTDLPTPFPQIDIEHFLI